MVETIRGSTPAVSWWRSAAPTSPPAVERHGGQRQPVEDRRQRLSRAHPVLGAAGAGLTVVAPFFTGLFEDLRRDARGGRHRRRHRARRRPCARGALRHAPRRLGRQFVSPPRLHRRGGRPARVTVFGTLPGLFIGIGVSLLLLVYRPSRPYVACARPHARPRGGLPRHRDPRRRATARRHRRPEDRERLYFANAETVRSRIVDAGGAEGVRGGSSMPRRPRSSTSPRSACSSPRTRSCEQRRAPGARPRRRGAGYARVRQRRSAT